jgi:hypothetical protein
MLYEGSLTLCTRIVNFTILIHSVNDPAQLCLQVLHSVHLDMPGYP